MIAKTRNRLGVAITATAAIAIAAALLWGARPVTVRPVIVRSISADGGSAAAVLEIGQAGAPSRVIHARLEPGLAKRLRPGVIYAFSVTGPPWARRIRGMAP